MVIHQHRIREGNVTVQSKSMKIWMRMGIHTKYFTVDLWNVKNPNGVKAFGIHLRRLRESKSLSQQELADLSDVAKTSINRYENAHLTATVDALISIARGLDVPLTELTNFAVPKEKAARGT